MGMKTLLNTWLFEEMLKETKFKHILKKKYSKRERKSTVHVDFRNSMNERKPRKSVNHVKQN